MWVAEQAGVGLMLGEERGVQGVVVKQLVPRGSADRTGVVRVGDQLLSVGDEDVSHQTVSNMRHLIIGRLFLTTVIRPCRACVTRFLGEKIEKETKV